MTRWRLADRVLEFPPPLAAGIVNVTDDSFFEGARSGTPDRAVQDGLARLAPDARVALVMAAHGFSGREIATSLGRTETATRTLMFRAREQMRGFLADPRVSS